MTATIIDFPVVKRPPAKKPLSRKERLEQIFNVDIIEQRYGLGPEGGSKHDPDGDNTA